MNRHHDYISGAIGDGPMLFVECAMLANIQLSYIVALLARLDLLTDHPAITAYWRALQQQLGFFAATEATGPMAPPVWHEEETT